MFNIETGRQDVSIDTSGELAAIVFSHDSQRLVVVTWKRIQVWDLVNHQLYFEVPFFPDLDVRLLLEMKLREDRLWEYRKHLPQYRQIRPNCQAISLSHDNRYLALLMSGQLVTYDVVSERRIAQTPFTGIPRFLKDGSLGILFDESDRGQGLKSKMDVRLQVLKTFPAEVSRSSTQCLRQVDDRYLAIEFSGIRMNWPQWVPGIVRQSVNQLFANNSKSWTVSLRNLETPDAEKQLTVPEYKIEVIESEPDLKLSAEDRHDLFLLRQSIAANRWDSTSHPPFRSTLVENNAWLVLQDSQSIELWPLLSYWRPWYCWATVSGLVAMAGYFVWYGRRVVGSDVTGK